jgi:hypothetical protein
MIETWKDVKDYEGFYQVSNFGNIRSVRREVKSPIRNNITIHRKGKLISAKPGKTGYCKVCLHKYGFGKFFPVHRLVAIAFIDNTESKPFINHIDGNPSNNNVENLEWCTQSENILHAYKIGSKKAPDYFYLKQVGKESPTAISIIQKDSTGNFIRKWDCINDVQRELGFNRPNICKCAKGKINTAYGFKWEYA